jgi:hypothetical protein
MLLLTLVVLGTGCARIQALLPTQAETPPPAALEETVESAPQEETQEETEEAAPEAPPPEPLPAAAPVEIDPANTDLLDSDRVICEAKGGRWSRAGGGFTCITPTADANNQCRAAADCEGYCLARSGTCAPFTPLYGCHDIIAPSGGMQTVCIN